MGRDFLHLFHLVKETASFIQDGLDGVFHPLRFIQKTLGNQDGKEVQIVGDVGLEMMKAINQAYDTLKNLDSWSCESGTNEETLKIILEVWEKINTLNGIKGELCGTWLWISGDTWNHKKVLKNVGCKWASKKKMWYWRPEGYKKKSKKIMDMGTIRNLYGTEILETKTVSLIA